MRELKTFGTKILVDIALGIVAAVFAHYVIINIAPGIVTRITGLVGNTGTSVELTINEAIAGYGQYLDVEKYAEDIAKQKQAELQRRKDTMDNIKKSFKEMFSIFNCFLILFGIRFIIAYLSGDYKYDENKTNNVLKIEVGKKE